jgi:hypothetical protein
MNYGSHKNKKSSFPAKAGNPVLSRPSGCRIKSGMTENAVYGQTLNKKHFVPLYKAQY